MRALKGILRIINPYYKHSVKRCLTSKLCENVEVEVEKEKSIIVKNYQKVTIIGINRPEKKNCLNVAMTQQLLEELNKFDNDENSLIGVLYGVGGNFCSGYDLTEIAQYNGENEEVLPQFGPLANKNELSKKPLIAAISGYAVGVGFELALMCDMRVMEENSHLGFLNKRFGIPILCGGTVRLPALIGHSRATDLILTGRMVDTMEAFSWGLANRQTLTGAALGNAVNLAASCIKYPESTIFADRASLNYATFSAKHLEEAMQFEKDNASHLLFEEGVKGAKKFCIEGIGKHGKSRNIKSTKIRFKELDETYL